MRVDDEAYKTHRVFAELDELGVFYKDLSSAVLSFATMGTGALLNMDSYIYSSVQGTVESIRAVLRAGRINDAYALLRKYYDSAVINVWSNLYLRKNFSVENFVVQKVDGWLKGRERLPEFRAMSQYIKQADELREMTSVLAADDRYRRLRERCNDHMHYNYFRHVLLNDNVVHIESRGKWLDRISADSRDIFVLHMGYIFFLNRHYMMSSDYLDAMECGMRPKPDSQYLVAPFVQETFDRVIEPWRPEVKETLKAHTSMQLR